MDTKPMHYNDSASPLSLYKSTSAAQPSVRGGLGTAEDRGPVTLGGSGPALHGSVSTPILLSGGYLIQGVVSRKEWE